MTDTNILDIWIKRIAHEKMPVLSHTITAIAKVIENEKSPRSALTNIILQDPGMTSHVLRLANSIYYAPVETSSRLNTVSRAVVVLGVNVIRTICITAAVINELFKGGAREHLLQEMARSFHAAVQARDFAEARGEEAPEEIFIAALLYRIGELAFWCFGDHLRELLEAELENPDVSPGEAELSVLGFRLSQLSIGLCSAWNLGDLVPAAIKNTGGPQSASRTITLCYRLARALEDGWETQTVAKCLRDLNANTGLSIDTLKTRIAANARNAIKVAAEYGAASAAHFIPLPPETEAPDVVTVIDKPTDTNKADPMLQLRVLRELASLLNKEADIGTILEMVLEGIYRGIGMDRAFFALLSGDRKYLKAKSVLGSDPQRLTTDFVIKIDPSDPSIFYYILEEQRGAWVPEKVSSSIKLPLPAPITRIIGDGPFFIAPAIVNHKSIGIFYADRKSSGRPLDIDSYESFAHFTLQANLSMDILGLKSSPHK